MKNKLSSIIKINASLREYGFYGDMTIAEAKAHIKDLKFIQYGFNIKTSVSLDKILKIFADKYKVETPFIYYHIKPYPINVYFDCYFSSHVLSIINKEDNNYSLNKFLKIYDALLENIQEKYKVCIKMKYSEGLVQKNIAVHEKITMLEARFRIQMGISFIRSGYNAYCNSGNIPTLLKEPNINSSIDFLNLSTIQYRIAAHAPTIIKLYEIYIIEKHYNISIIDKIRDISSISRRGIIEKFESFLNKNDDVMAELLAYKDIYLNNLNKENYLDHVIYKVVFYKTPLCNVFKEDNKNRYDYLDTIIDFEVFNSYALKDFTDSIRTRPYKDMSPITVLSIYKYFELLNRKQIVEDHILIQYPNKEDEPVVVTYQGNKEFCEKYLLNRISEEDMELVDVFNKKKWEIHLNDIRRFLY